MYTVYFGHGLYGAVRFFRVRHGDVFVSAVVVVVTECETVFILYSGREFEVVYERRFYVRTSYRYVEISVLYYVGVELAVIRAAYAAVVASAYRVAFLFV